MNTNLNTNLDTNLDTNSKTAATQETPDPQLALLETIADTMNLIANRLAAFAQQTRPANTQNDTDDDDDETADRAAGDDEAAEEQNTGNENDDDSSNTADTEPDDDEGDEGDEGDIGDGEPTDNAADDVDDDLDEDLDDLLGGLDEFMDDINKLVKGSDQAAFRPWCRTWDAWSTRTITAPAVTTEPVQSGGDNAAAETGDGNETQTRRYRRGPYSITITRRRTTR